MQAAKKSTESSGDKGVMNEAAETANNVVSKTTEAVSKTTEAANEVVNTHVKSLAQFLSESLNIETSWMWVLQIFIVVFFTLLASYAVNVFLKKLHNKL
ncbi:MAG: hypothetical protein MK052_10515, partial [Alphaproteobacteria bacterium]|nr:hypothetical protein [Alphaproteobacteria bacterium]